VFIGVKRVAAVAAGQTDPVGGEAVTTVITPQSGKFIAQLFRCMPWCASRRRNNMSAHRTCAGMCCT
jgi:hypothetical protein